MKKSPIPWPREAESTANGNDPGREPASRASVSPPEALAGRRVLVIDDKPDMVAALRYALELSGHVVEVAYDGEGGICKALQTNPEVILSDIGLPGRADGFVVAETLRASGLFDSTYMVAITGASAPEDVERAATAGFDLHVAKPADVRAILRMIAELPNGGV
jgi:CheY-like chemotaxis protein